MADDMHARLDELVDTDPLQLRDEAFALLRRAEQAEAERDAAVKLGADNYRHALDLQAERDALQAKLSTAQRRSEISAAGLALAHRRQAEYKAERDAVMAAAAESVRRHEAVDVNSPEAVGARFDEYEVHLALANTRIESARTALVALLDEARRFERTHAPSPDCACDGLPMTAEAIEQVLAALNPDTTGETETPDALA